MNPSGRPGDKRDYEQQLREVNEALLVSSVHQQELAEQAQEAEAALRKSQVQLEKQLADTELLAYLSSDVHGQGNLAWLYEKLLDAAVAIMHSDMASIQAVDEEEDALRMLASRGFGAALGLVFELNRGDTRTSCSLARRHGRRVVVEDVETCDFIVGTPALEAYRGSGIRAVQSTPLFTRNGKLVGMISTHWRRPHRPSASDLRVLDILARQAADVLVHKQAEEALRASAAEARRLLELNRITTAGMAEGMYTVESHGLVTSVNPAAERLLGWRAGELLGRCMHEVTHYKRPDGSAFPVEECPGFQVLRQGEAVKDFEDTFIKKDETFFPVSYSSSALRDPDGTVIGLVVVFQDVSERVRAREEQARAAQELAQLNSRKDEFLAMLSHELRNPLAPIRAAVHLMRTQDSGENLIQQQAREIIERQVGNLTKIVNDLLEVSRVVSGRIRLDLQAVDLKQVVGYAVDTTRLLFQQHKHSLSVELCDESVWVNGDVIRLEEVLVNLLNNAVKYTPDGGRIEVHCEQPRWTTLVQVRVRDNGVGIDRDLLRDGRIFDLFTQADRSLARSAGGLGIGLSLAHRLVGLHGGSIEARSPPDGANVGSELIVRLPLVAAPRGPDSREPDAPLPKPEGLRVLVVDDNVDLVMALAISLRQVGYNVQCAHSGPEGLKVAEMWRPDVVLLDIGLPGLDGYQVAKRLRSDASLGTAGKTMQLIAMTGYGQSSDQALASEAGFDTHMTKPVEFEDLQRAISTPPAAPHRVDA